MKLDSTKTWVTLVVIGAGGFWAGRFSTSATSGAALEQGQKSRISLTPRHNAASEAEARRMKPSERRPAPGSPQALARLAAILRNENPLDRNRALFAYVDRLGPEDFKTAAEYFRGLGLTESRMGEYALLLSAWSKLDPLAALDFARSLPEDNFSMDTVLAAWSSRDPHAALFWAEANHEGEGSNPYLVGVIRGMAETDPNRATALLAGMPPGRARDEAMEGILPQLLAQGADAAKSWIENLADEQLRQSAMDLSAELLATSDPAGTATWLQEHPGEASLNRMDDVYQEWARLDPGAAIESVTSMPAGESRSKALGGVVGAMATSDPEAALTLLDEHPDDVDENVLKSFLWHSLESDPALAISQIPRIEDEGRRDWWYGHTLGAWLDRDADAANAWMRANAPSQSVLNYLAESRNAR